MIANFTSWILTQFVRVVIFCVTLIVGLVLFPDMPDKMILVWAVVSAIAAKYSTDYLIQRKISKYEEQNG